MAGQGSLPALAVGMALTDKTDGYIGLPGPPATSIDGYELEECPRCRTLAPSHIIYWYPVPQSTELASKGEIVVPRRAVTLDSPSHWCSECGLRFQTAFWEN